MKMNKVISNNGKNSIPLIAVSREKTIPATTGQARIWYLSQIHEPFYTYNDQMEVRVDGTLDIPFLEACFKKIIERHEVLRTVFSQTDEGDLNQIILAPFSIQIPVIPVVSSNMEDSELELEINRVCLEQGQARYDLSEGPLFRVCILQLPNNQQIFLFSFHHTIMDGRSLIGVLKEINILYKSKYEGASEDLDLLPIQVADYACWEKRWIENDDFKNRLSFWKEELADLPSSLELPTDKPKPAKEKFYGAWEYFQLPKSLTVKLESLSRQENVSLYTILLAAYNILLGRYANQKDIVIGTVIANRLDYQIQNVFGFFAETVLLRTDLSVNKTFKVLLQNLRSLSKEVFYKQAVPLNKLVEVLRQDGTLSDNAIFQAMLIFKSVPFDEGTLAGSNIVHLSLRPMGISKFDITIAHEMVDGCLEGYCEYNTDLFELSTIKRFLSHYQLILETICEDVEENIETFPLLTKQESQKILIDWNATQANYPNNLCVYELFENQVKKTPKAIAAIYDKQELTYQDLNNRSNQLAFYLRKQGIGADHRVGLCVERSLDMVVGLLGIIKAGAAYVPLDPDYPKERLAYMLKEADVSILVTQTSLHNNLPTHKHTIDLDDINSWYEKNEYSENALKGLAKPENLVYVIFTSGSTGKPKAVAMPHQALVNLIFWQLKNSESKEGTRTLQFSPISFDVSFQEMFSTWCSGGTLVLISDELRRDPFLLWRFLKNEKINRLFMPFIALQQLAEAYYSAEDESVPESLVEIVTAGEQLQITPLIKKMFKALPDCKLYNHYGPSETHVVTSLALDNDPEGWEFLPTIGKPIANNSIYILDKYLNPVPIGVFGEIFIGGTALARGYLNNKEQTTEHFIDNPFIKNEKLYRTGDLARYREDGEIEYKGRADDQIKIRGFRIELGEIEKMLSNQPDIKESVVTVHNHGDGAQTKYLVAYIIPEEGVMLDKDNLRQAMKSALPEYMVPSIFITLDSLPLTPSGKVDRKALPKPDKDEIEVEGYVEPRTETEKNIARIWSKILGISLEKIGIDNNFFELGGHSLLATQVASHIRKFFNAEIPIRDIFNAKTIRSLALVIDDSRKSISEEGYETSSPLVPVDRNKALPLSFAQQRLWFLNQLEGGDDVSYNMPYAFSLKGKLNEKALKEAFNKLINRHESLRTTFQTIEGKTIQSIADDMAIDIPIVDAEESSIEKHIHDNAVHIFDLTKGPLIKATLLKLSTEDYILLTNMHHIISDGWSLSVFNHELSILYKARIENSDIPLSPLPIQYGDFSSWQRQWLSGDILDKQLNYWKSQLKDAPELLEFPTDYPRPAVQTYRGSEEKFLIDKKLATQLSQLANREGATLFMVLMAIFKILIYRYSGMNDFCVGTVVANRRRQELEGLIGFFVNTLVLRDRIEDSISFKDFLRQVRQTALSAYAHQDIPFEYLVDEINPERSLSYMPLTQVLLVLQNTAQESLKFEGLEVSKIEGKTFTSKFDMIMELSENPDGIIGRLEYSTDLFNSETIKKFINHFKILLNGVVKDSQKSIALLPLVTLEQRQVILKEWNNQTNISKVAYSIPELFEEQAKKRPDAVAVVYDKKQLTYRGLNEKSNQLAHYLIEKGVGPESRVGLSLNRSIEMLIGILGTLKAGGAYVPIDPDNPQDRIQYILKDSNIPLLVTQAELQEKLLEENSVERIFLDKDWKEIERYSTKNPNVNLEPLNLAYVIYTSGSTGRPKGTLVSHANVIRLFTTTEKQFGFNKNDIWTLFHSFAFDFSVWEIWGALLYGGKVIVVPYWISREPESFCRLVYDEGVTVLNQTPSAFNQFIATDKTLAISSEKLRLRYVIFGGEALDMQSLVPWFERHGDQQPQLINMYGITETTVHVTYSQLSKANINNAYSIIGRQLADLEAYILDRQLELAPIGVPGELYVGGGGVVRGYHGRPDLTAERFIPNFFNGVPGTRLYKTGDLVRFNETGDMEYLGRIDQQVKVRGFRIELGEIQSRLLEHPAVQEGIVIVREDDPGEKRLVAYLVPDKSYELPKEESEQLISEAVSQWQDVFENNYSATTAIDPFQDFTGWNDSYDGSPIPEEQMREWADNAAEAILALKPKNILEIACGSGLLTGRLVPHCESYVGTDFSSVVLKQLHDKLPHLGKHAEKVSLFCGPADDLSELAGQKFDTIVLNSVIQYFPDLEYLLIVLEQAKKLLSIGGHIFLGDIRHFGLAAAFHSSVQLYKSKDSLRTVAELKRLTQYHAAIDNELLISPDFFQAFKENNPEFTHIQVIPKLGSYQNELSAYRYDVVLHTSDDSVLNKDIDWIDWKTNSYSIEKLENQLREKAPKIFALRGVTNDRLTRDMAILALFKSKDFDDNVIEGKSIQAAEDKSSTNPCQLKKMADTLGYNSEFSWLSGTEEGDFHVVFHKNNISKQSQIFNIFPLKEISVNESRYKSLANNPRFHDFNSEVLSVLRDYLQKHIPAYMVPSSFVFLENLPLNQNGKIDKKALPKPDADLLLLREYVPPSTDTQRNLIKIWSEILKVPSDKIGVNDDFFDLGGHSLLATRVVSHIRKVFKVEAQIRDLFNAKTIKDLAVLVDDESDGKKESKECTIVPVDRSNYLPLSFAQQRLWFINQLEGGKDISYNIAWALKLYGKLDINALKASFQKLVERHEILRTAFLKRNGEAFQFISEDVVLDFPVKDVKKEDVEKHAYANANYIFDLTQAPLLKIALLRLSSEEYVLLINIHHIIFDGWSMGTFNRELSVLYLACSEGKDADLPDLSVQYADFSCWQRQWLQGDVLEKQLNYWKEKLKGTPELLELPTDYPRPAKQSYRGAAIEFAFSKSLSSNLNALARKEGTTLFMVVMAALKVLLYRYSGMNDISIGTAVANRQREELENLIGFFVNTLVIRDYVDSSTKFQDFLKEVKSTALLAYANQDIPFEYLIEELNPERSLSHSPLFQVMLVLQNTSDDTLKFPGVKVDWVTLKRQTAKFDLLLALKETEEGIVGDLEYNTDLFAEDTVVYLLDRFKNLLKEIIDNPKCKVSDFTLLTKQEVNQQLIEWNNTEVIYSKVDNVPQLFEKQVLKTPDGIAVAYKDQSLTYNELNRLANQFAYYLLNKNLPQNARVGLCLERSLEIAIAILGILKAGMAYIPLDANYPKERLSYMLEKADVSVLVTQNTLRKRLPDHGAIIELDDNNWRSSNDMTNANPTAQAVSDNLAYIIYTSGSTGKPKAVAMPHGSLVNLIQWQKSDSFCGVGEKTLQFSPISFDVSFQEMFSTWYSGGVLVLIPDDLRRDPFLLWSFLNQAQINRLFMPFIALQQLAEAYQAAESGHVPNHLKEIIVAGEQLQITPLIRELFKALRGCRLYNHYGPSESHVVTSLSLTGSPDTWEYLPSIGFPIANNHIYILDKDLNPLPIGVYGEIYIGGSGLAKGYLGNLELTRERFIDNPFIPGERLYKTGDLARYRKDGSIEYKGRTDNQFKIRGFRIELGEVEHVLAEQPGVQEAVVTVHTRIDDAQDKYLVAYVVPEKEVLLDQNILEKALKKSLPEYMVPTVFMILKFLPVTPSGKVDRKSLPKPDKELIKEDNYIPPTTEYEHKLGKIWSEILNISEEKIGIKDNFFELGGNSISVIKAVSLCRSKGVSVTPKDFFDYPTISEIASLNKKDKFWEDDLNLEKEMKLADCITAGELPLGNFSEPKSILLTGATGFVGSFLLRELISRTEASIYCLVKAESSEKALVRLKNSLIQYKIYDADKFSRVIPIKGDLSLPLLGLSEAEFDRLGEEVDVIYHNGAWVNHVLPYNVLKPANVSGTHEILRLASHRKLKAVHHISTTACSYIRKEDVDTYHSISRFGYVLSKYVSEKLIEKGGERGLPITIYRLGMILGDSITGVSNTTNRVSKFIKGCAELNCIPDIEGLSEILPQTLTPIDYACKFIVDLSKQKEGCSKIYNIDSPQLVDWNTLLEAFKQFGYQMKVLPFELWIKKVSEMADQFPNEIYDALLGLYYQEESKVFYGNRDSDGKNDCFPQELELQYCMVEINLINKYLTYFFENGFINNSSVKTNVREAVE